MRDAHMTQKPQGQRFLGPNRDMRIASVFAVLCAVFMAAGAAITDDGGLAMLAVMAMAAWMGVCASIFAFDIMPGLPVGLGLMAAMAAFFLFNVNAF